MKNLEDLLPILFILIPVLNVIIKSVSQKKKQKEVDSTQSTPPILIDRDDNYIPSATVLDSEEKIVAIPDKNQSGQVLSNTQLSKGKGFVRKRINIENTDSSIMSRPEKLKGNNAKRGNKKLSESISFKNGDDLKKAVILSEILHKKYS